MAGTRDAPHLELVGSALFDVTPGVYAQFVVTNADTKVEVIGTRFGIAEEASGTLINVERGQVAVSCTAGDEITLEASQSHTCPTPSASGMLVQARSLQQAGAPGSQVLAAAERGLRYPAQLPQLHDALQVIRLQALVELGREHEAAAAIDAYLASGASLRRAEVEALSARLRAER